MKHHALILLVAAVALTGCDQKLHSPRPDAVRVTLSPDVVSSQDGTMHVTATVLEALTPLQKRNVVLSIDFTDRNGIPRLVAGTAGITGRTGSLAFDATGLKWAGAGTVTAAVMENDGTPAVDRFGTPITGSATFAVLDLSPPQVTIDPPTADLRVGPNLPFDVPIHVTDEIGVSQVFVQLVGELNGGSSRIVASGTTDGHISFGFDVPGNALPGPTITIYAMAQDLSGNLAAAAPVTLTVDPAITVGVLPGFSVRTVTSGTIGTPLAIALSPKDSMLYVADAAGSTCGNGCIRRVDPVSGAISGTLVVSGQPVVTGLSFDATGDNLYYTVSGNDAIVRLTWNGAAYAGPVTCNVLANQNPPSPRHSIFDPTLGMLIADDGDKVLKREASCGSTDPTDFAGAGTFDQPWGVAANGSDFYVSDMNQDRIYHVTAAGATNTFELSGLNQPQGMEWLAGGSSIFADSLLVANNGHQRLTSTRGNFTSRSAAYFRNPPVDLALTVGTAFVITEQGNGPSRIYAISGF